MQTSKNAQYYAYIESLRLDAYNDSLEQVRDATGAFCAAILDGRSPTWLTISGKSGCGKTYIAKRLYNFCNRRLINWRDADGNMRTRDAHYARMVDLADQWAAGQWRNELAERADLLVLDDLGAERTTDYLKDRIMGLLERRIGKWTLITTNLSLLDIAKRYDARLSSRLIRDGNRFLTVEAQDYARRNS